MEIRSSDKNIEDSVVSDLENALLSSDRVLSGNIMSEYCRGKDPFECINNLIIPALERIGNAWERGDAALSQIYVSGKICEGFIEKVSEEKGLYIENQPRIGIAVLEDHHSLGKQTVIASLHAAGLRVIDYGSGLTAEELSERAVKDNIEILLVSALMLRAALKTGDLVKALRARGSRAKVVVGGAPFLFEPELWKDMEADAMGTDAADTIDIIRKFGGIT